MLPSVKMVLDLKNQYKDTYKKYQNSDSKSPILKSWAFLCYLKIKFLKKWFF
jgi:hypothetical protein